MHYLRIVFFLLPILIINTSNTSAQEITEWRGIARTGYFPTKNILSEWPEEGPKMVLHLENLPGSYSSVVVKDEIMYTTGIEDSTEILTALFTDGTRKWKTTYGRSWDQSFSNARCTPTIEGNYAYVISGKGDLACIDISNGNLSWSLNGYREYEGRWGKWGTAESPLIIGDKMIYTPGGTKTTMVAVNKHTGELEWMTESLADNSAYTSPVLIERGPYKLIITLTASYVICVNAENGELFWKFDYSKIDPPKMGGDINPVTPVVVGDDVFVTSGYDHVGIMLHMAGDYKSVSMKWKTEKMDVHHGGVVVQNGFLYAANYTSVVDGNWVCLDWETGTLQYEENWKGKGSIIATEGYLICYDERRGHVGLMEINPHEFNIKSTFRVEYGRGPHWSHPTIYNDYLFIRHGEDLMVYDIGRR